MTAVSGGGSTLSAGLLAVPAAVLAGSAMTCAVIGLDRRLHQMSYYFLVSLAVQHALMSISVMLPGVHVLQTGTSSSNWPVTKTRPRLASRINR